MRATDYVHPTTSGGSLIQLDTWIATGLLFLGVLSRLPFRSEILYHWDSVNLALATTRFDVSIGQPQVPGYILYVAVAWLASTVVGDPQNGMVALSVLFSGLSAVITYYLGRHLYDRRTGITASLFLLVSPLFWFYGEVALPHVVDTFLVTTVALILYRAWDGDTRKLYFAAALTALAGGFRPQTAAFLALLCLLVALRFPFRSISIAAGIGVVVVVAWLVPLLWLSGGLAQYESITASYSAAFSYWAPVIGLAHGDPHPLLAGAAKLTSYTAYAAALTAIPPIVYFATKLRSLPDVLKDRRAAFLAAWVLPSLCFYLFVHMGQQGLIFVFFPALLLMSAAALCGLLAARPGLLVATVGTIALIQTGTFALAPEYVAGQKILNWSTIRRHDQFYVAMIDGVRNDFLPDRTVLAAASWRHPAYYLPEYRMIRLPSFDPEGDAVASMGPGDSGQPISTAALGLPEADVTGLTVVLLDGDKSQVPDGVSVKTIDLPQGAVAYWFTLQPGQQLTWNDGRLAISD